MVPCKKNPFEGLLRSRKVLLAFVGVVQTVLFQFVPDFPPEVWQSINILIGLVIVGITAEDAAEKRGKNGG